MTAISTRDVEYSHDGTRLLGLLIAADGAVDRPTVLLVHDAFGLGGFSLDEAYRYAGLGYTVFAADMWGDRAQPAGESEIGPLIGSMAGDRERWHGRTAAAHDAATAQTEVDPDRIAAVGYCFGGSTALEHARVGGEVRGVVAIHPGLDLIDLDMRWTPADDAPRVLLCAGADDPMATGEMRTSLERQLSRAGVDWELDLYSDTVHAFTNPALAASPRPDLFAYHPRSAARAWESTRRFLAEVLAEPANDSKRNEGTHV